MLSAICILGKGDSFGIHARVYPVAEAKGGLSSIMSGAKRPDFPKDVSDALTERWAPLSSTVIPPSVGAHVLKISRHLDSSGRVWTWIGYYQASAFKDESRGGLYFGAGIAFCDALVSGDVGAFLDYLLERLEGATFADGQMSRSIYDVSLRLEFSDLHRLLSFEALPEKLAGVSPAGNCAVFRHERDWAADTIEKIVRESLEGPMEADVAGVFVGSWDMSSNKGQFYLADNEGVLLSGIESDCQSVEGESATIIKNSQPGPKPYPTPEYPQPRYASRDDVVSLTRRIDAIERRLIELSKGDDSRYPDGAVRPRMNAFQRVVLLLLSIILLIQLTGVWQYLATRYAF